jgi:hypothetical protein
MMFFITLALFLSGFHMDTQLFDVPRSMPKTRPAKGVSLLQLSVSIVLDVFFEWLG